MTWGEAPAASPHVNVPAEGRFPREHEVRVEREGIFRRVARALSPRSRETAPGRRRATTEEYVNELIDRRVRGGSRSVHVSNPFEQNGPVYRAILAVAGALADAPLEPWSGPDRKTGKLIEKGQLPLLLKKPNRLMTQRDWKFTVAAQAMLFRQSDVLVKEGRISGQVAELIPLPPGSVKPIHPRSDPYDLVGWRFNYFGHRDVIGPEGIIRFRYALDPLDPLSGVHPFLPVRDVIDTDYAATRYNKSALERGGSFGGIVQMEPEPGEEAEEVDDETAAEIRRRIDERLHGGPDAAEQIAVISARMKWIPTGKAAKDLQYIQGKALNVKDIARAPGIPPLFMNEFEGIGLGHEGLATQYRMLYHNAVFPFATGLEEGLTERVGKRFGDDITIIHNWDNVDALKEDAKARLDRAAIMMRDLECSRNEVNDALDLGMQNTPEGGVVLVQAGKIPKKVAIEGFAAPEPTGADPAAEPTAAPAAPEKGAPVETSQDTVLNGAQISAALDIVKSVATGELPRDSGIGMLMTMFNLTAEQAEAMMGSAGTGSETTPNRNPADDAGAPPPPPSPPPPAEPETASAVAKLARVHRDAVERRRARMWRRIVKQVKPYEKRILTEVRGYLDAQRKAVQQSLESRAAAPSHARAAAEDAAAAVEPFNTKELAEWIRGEILKTFTASAKAAGSQLLDFGLVDADALKADTSRLPALSERYFAARAGRITDSADRIKARLRDSLHEGYARGESLSDLKDRVGDVIEAADLGQARTIARTEAHTAANNSRFSLMKRQGVGKHEWLSSKDEHVRGSHRIDGEVREIGVPFSNGMLHPGDPNAPPEESINDRCATLPVAEDFEAFEEATSEAAALDTDDLWSRNLARRAIHLRVEAPCLAIARRIPELVAADARAESTAGGAETLRAQLPKLSANPAVAGAVRTLSGTVFASIWLDAWREAA